MKKIFKNYKNSFILLLFILIGTILGLVFKENICFLKPLGDLFINMLMVIIVPLIFLTISTSIGKLKSPKRVGKVISSIILVFIFTSLISVVVGIIFSRIQLVNLNDTDSILNNISGEIVKKDEVNLIERTVNTLTTDDFINLLSKDNIIALIVVSVITGVGIILSKEKGTKALEVLDSFNEILKSILNIIMYYAPIGLGCYFANFVGTFGSSIAVGYLKTFIIYLIVSLFIYFVVYSIYVYIAGGKKCLKLYWKNIIPVTITALSTCSSAASIPTNIKTSESLGVSEDIANTTIPLGSSFHKDGSIVGSVFKIMFLAYLFNIDVGVGKLLIVSLIVSLLVTGIPIGGGTISEMLILTLMGYPLYALPILTLIATIIDAPATVLNVVGDTASSVMVSRIVDGKNHLNKKDL